MNILVINGGSSSLKCWFHRVTEDALREEDPPVPLWTAHVEYTNGAAEVKVTTSRDGVASRSVGRAASLAETLPTVLESLLHGDTKVVQQFTEIDVVGHRIVHGGRTYRETALLTEEAREAIAAQCEFAPSHNRLEIEAIRSVDRIVGSGVRQIGVFDTGFHNTLRPEAYVYPGPYEWLEHGVRRYGFHGISHQYATRRAVQSLGRVPRLIVCHLGGGCSLAAVRDGKCVDTTMGFTPLDGLMMGSRSGSIDPGILTYLLRHRGYTADEIDRILNQESGLKGVSGVSGDMREVLAAMSAGNPRARLAFDVYGHRLCREAGAMLAVLGGLDALVFTGGVGENCPPLRERVCRQFGFLGLRLDEQRNSQPDAGGNLATGDSTVAVMLIPAQEEWEIARECWRFSERS